MTTAEMIEAQVKLGLNGLVQHGNLAFPALARGVVLSAPGSGSGRFRPRNRLVARHLTWAGLATLRIDLLTEVEERADYHMAHLRFNIGRPVIGMNKWALQRLGSPVRLATDWFMRYRVPANVFRRRIEG